ncbi:MAG: hypothetical protein J5I47_08300 [Vicingus serpentipes]|nr:hypothetical protein [Vicingus serpentipes]
MRSLIIYSLLLFVFLSCGGEVSDQKIPKSDSLQVNQLSVGQAKIFEPIQDEEIVVLENEGITLTEIKSNNEEEISLELVTNSFKEGENELMFTVKGMEDYSIAVIENNYTVNHYQKNIIPKEFMYGNNVFLAFLTHSNGVGVKTNKALVLKNVLIDDESLFNMNQPHLFYYLPKEQTITPILDFCLVNTTIKKGGNQLKVTINGIEFMFDKWAAYKIEGLTKSENTIRIKLLDKEGKLIEGPFNDSGDRVFRVVKEST